MPASSATARQRAARSRSRWSGFSQKIGLPARAPASIRSACVSVELAISSASMESSAIASRADAMRAPCNCASVCAAATSLSATQASSAPARVTRVAAWIRPIRPAPMSANLCMRGGLRAAPSAVARRALLDAVRIADHERLRKTERRRQRAELTNFRVLDLEVQIRLAGDRAQTAVADGEHLCAACAARGHDLGRLARVGMEAHGDQEVLVLHDARLLAQHPSDAVNQVGALVDVPQRIGQ